MCCAIPPPHLPCYTPVSRLGRAPSVFKASNSRVRNRRLRLISRRDRRFIYPDNPPSMPAEPRVYANWTTAFVESRSLVQYGYFQVRAQYVFSLAFIASRQ